MHLAVEEKIATATQNQAINALLFLYREVLKRPFESVKALRAKEKKRLPVVLTENEVRLVLGAMSGPTQLAAKLLYGSGLRLMEALRLRIQDVDFEMKQVTVRRGKGDKERWTTLGANLIEPLKEHLERCICRTRWRGSARLRRGNGDGSGCFRRGTFRRIRGVGLDVAITWRRRTWFGRSKQLSGRQI